MSETTQDRSATAGPAVAPAVPPHRYTAALAARIEAAWQDRWERERTFEAPNPAGPLADPAAVGARPKLYLLDMFPYPSGAGLHVGHPLGYIATDVVGRYHRMTGHNVLHALGYDAFGLPAEQYAVATGQHPRVTTEANVERYRAQIRRLGLAHDSRRGVATTDPGFYRWTQWIFLQIFNSWYDPDADRARPIADLITAYESGDRATPDGREWSALSPVERSRVIDEHRLAYLSQAPVNWCPGLGTVLANEEVTNEGRSERGNFPVFKRNLWQWKMRITAYADRLAGDLDRLDWPEPIKAMQRNWIGRSEGAVVCFATTAGDLEVFTTRPDTLFGATFMVLAPEHPMVDALTAASWPVGTKQDWKGESPTGAHESPRAAVTAYRLQASALSDLQRQGDTDRKTGVFTGAWATNPVTGRPIPVFVADYVLMGYGTGAIMAVPGQDQRDWDFAKRYELPIVRTVAPPEDWEGEAYAGAGPAIASANAEVSLDGLDVDEAKARITTWLVERGLGRATVSYKLRDWLFSRQRYWGEPFPIVYDADGLPHALPEAMLPLELPEVDDYSPRTFDPDDADTDPEPPLARATSWVHVELDLGAGPQLYRRETSTMPQWAGSCWYELRYLDPTNSERFVDPQVEAYWMGPRRPGDTGGVDLYVGGVEHAVLHLLYARFWHKVLYDLGYVSSEEPFARLVNQGYIQAYAYTDERGVYVPADEVSSDGAGFTWRGRPVRQEYGKMGKSLKNSVSPDDMSQEYGADTLRLYEMSMGPLEQSRPWETRAVVGSYRFLQRLWRTIVDEDTGTLVVVDDPAELATRRALHRTIDGVRRDMTALRFNTAIAKLIELTNHVTRLDRTPREVAEPLVLMLAPLAPHAAEELWRLLGHDTSLAYERFPEADPALLVEEAVTCVVQVAGKVRAKLQVAPDITAATLESLALADPAVQRSLAGRDVRTVVVRAPRLVNVVPV